MLPAYYCPAKRRGEDRPPTADVGVAAAATSKSNISGPTRDTSFDSSGADPLPEDPSRIGDIGDTIEYRAQTIVNDVLLLDAKIHTQDFMRHATHMVVIMLRALEHKSTDHSHVFIIAYYLMCNLAVIVPWSFERFASANPAFQNVGHTNTTRERRREDLFPVPDLGHITHPAVVVDIDGRIGVWYLPDNILDELSVSTQRKQRSIDF